jgi:hypothetical protein
MTVYPLNCKTHGTVYLSEPEYMRQLMRPNDLWVCPICGQAAEWDDTLYEKSLGIPQDEEEEESF